jgi:hypothetical protein
MSAYRPIWLDGTQFPRRGSPPALGPRLICRRYAAIWSQRVWFALCGAYLPIRRSSRMTVCACHLLPFVGVGTFRLLSSVAIALALMFS